MALFALIFVTFFCEVLMTYPYFSLPWNETTSLSSGAANVNYDENGFQVKIDVHQFKPEEIKVKVIDKFVIVEGKTNNQNDNGIYSRQFMRKYKIPDDIDSELLDSDINSSGVLVVKAPKKRLQVTSDSGERSRNSESFTETHQPPVLDIQSKEK